MVEQHHIQYEILNTHSTNTETGRFWNIDVHATPEELKKNRDGRKENKQQQTKLNKSTIS